MSKHIFRRRNFVVILLIALALVAASCASDQSVLIRSDMPTQGMDASVTYKITSTPDGTSEVNQAILTGMNSVSPLPLLTTTFGKGAGARTQFVQATAADGTAVNVLGMAKRTITFGLSDFLVVDESTYDFRDAVGTRVCGAKVRMNFQPNAVQFFRGDRRSWDALWYYSVPCANDPLAPLEIEQATFMALVLNQQTQFRVTGEPIVFNRGHSVTVVDGPPSELTGGWWEVNGKADSKVDLNSILGAASMIRDMVKDLDSNPTVVDGISQQWLDFTPGGKFASSKLIYSAGDADVFFSFQRAFFRRNVDYLVNFRADPAQPWRRVVVHPIYNFEWNDLSQNWEAYKDFNPLDIDDDRLDENGFPKDPNDDVLKEIETAGCQNCPNATLEQIQLLDGDSGDVLYSMTIRGYLGAENSLVMFGSPNFTLAEAQAQGKDKAIADGVTQCPLRYDDEGEALPATEQLSASACQELLREGAMWQLITENPDTFGFDLVSQYRVRDNSTWKQVCSGSGDSVFCSTIPLERKLDASYMFNNTDTIKPWTIMQLLGEVGVRTLGLSYASGQFSGSGLLFAMEQPMMRAQYFSGITNPELLFSFDARALQLPGTLAQAELYLYS